MHVKPEDDTINATADIQGNVTFYGGLVRRVGSDDEIAGVMGHEMAHVLLKHNEKAQQNMTVGMAIGGLITGVIAASAGPCYTAQCTNARTELLESIESVAERQRQERLVAKCEQLYREYPECLDWGKTGLPGFARLGRMTKGVCPFPAPTDCAEPE